MLNLLACRIQRGIDVNASCKAFLHLVRPKSRNLAKVACQGSNTELDVALADIESQTIIFIKNYHRMGGGAFPLQFLYGVPKGHMIHYANHYARRAQIYHDTYILDLSADTSSNFEDKVAFTPEDHQIEEPTDETARARDIIEDGVTLTRAEYRVLMFCMKNAVDSKRPIGGLHAYLARVMGVSRIRVTQLYESATSKLIAATRK